jgi:hypothetical protein
MNLKWHERHVLPKRASLEQRIAWHREHQAECACRPIPARLLEHMKAQSSPAVVRPQPGATPAQRTAPPSAAADHGDTRFSNIVLAFADQPSVSYGGKGFGSSALKFGGRIFAMLTSKGEFVVKLTRERVAELVEQSKGQHFDPGHGRLMTEWLVVPPSSRRWLELAKEAHSVASSRPSRISRPPAARISASQPLKARTGTARAAKGPAARPRRRTT